ncbi:hypothetical protein [Streptomyces sp. URMC 129]|uniref:hypothetical protein n=1 Tax=Streptomyces sp. URMC 129 TaxID=3423407 RepID=UPI003F1DAAF3
MTTTTPPQRHRAGTSPLELAYLTRVLKAPALREAASRLAAILDGSQRPPPGMTNIN